MAEKWICLDGAEAEFDSTKGKYLYFIKKDVDNKLYVWRAMLVHGKRGKRTPKADKK